jgi:peptide/nickel transport system substrate-binding protein
MSVLSKPGLVLRAALLAGVCALAAHPALAQDLTVGWSAEPTSADPQFHGIPPNYALARHIFDRLVEVDTHMRPIPNLAKSWSKVDDTTWQFELRPGVKFQDGTPLTADDVAFSFQRVQNIVGSPAPIKGYVAGMTVEVMGDNELRIHTARPDPLVPSEIAAVSILSRKIDGTATTDDFNRGTATIGTGPYRFVKWTQGDQIVLQRNPTYWGPKPAWDKVTIKFIPSAPARVAALLSHDVDFIENVPTTDYKRVKANPAFRVAESPANRVFYLAMDQFRKASPLITGPDGEKIDNPLMNQKVRLAMSKAIDRSAIRDVLMDGAADTDGQLVLPFFAGANPDVKPMDYDPDGAKKLLTDAGYPNGFSITLDGPNDQYSNDQKVEEAIGQMLTSIGINTTVEAMPGAVFFSKVATGGPNRTPGFSLYFNGFGGQTPDAQSALNFLIHTNDPAKGLGGANRGRYSNPDLDKLIEQAAATMDDTARNKILSQAMGGVADQQAYIVLYNQQNIWAMRKDLDYPPTIEEQTLAYKIQPAK